MPANSCIARLYVGLLCLVFPLLLLHTGKTLLWFFITTIILMSVTLWRCIVSRQFLFSSCHAGIWIVIFALVLNTLWSVHPSISQITVWKAGLGLWLCLLVMSECHGRNWQWLSVTVLSTTLFAAGWALIQYLSDFRRVSGPQIDVNTFAAIIYCGSFLWLFLRISDNRHFSVGFGAIQLLLLTAMMATFSRSGIFVWMLGVAGAFVIIVRLRLSFKPLFFYLVTGLCAYLLVKGLPFLFNIQGVSRHFNDIGSLNARIPQWQAAWNLFLTAPWSGTGLGTFKVLYPALRSEWVSAGNLAHNDYLQLLHEGGVFFFIAFVFWLLLHVFWLLKALKIHYPACQGNVIEKKKLQSELLFLLLINLLLFVHATINFIFYIEYLNVIVGMVFARIIWLATQLGFFKRPLRIPVRCATKIAVSCMVLVLWAKLALMVIPQMYFFEGRKEKLAEPNTLSLLLMVDPANVPASEMLVRSIYSVLANKEKEEQQLLFDTAWNQASVMHERTPAEPRYLYWLAILNRRAQELNLSRSFSVKSSYDYLQAAITLHPGYFPAHIELARIIEQEKGETESLAYLSSIFTRWHTTVPIVESLHMLDVLIQLADAANIPVEETYRMMRDHLAQWSAEPEDLRPRYEG